MFGELLLFAAMAAVAAANERRLRREARSRPPRRKPPALVARRHVQATYRSWARREGWIALDDAWQGKVRGIEATLSPHLEDDSPDEVELSVATQLSFPPAKLRSAAEAEPLVPALAPLFAEGAFTGIAWTAMCLELRFLPLTEPDIVVATAETALAALLAKASAEAPYR